MRLPEPLAASRPPHGPGSRGPSRRRHPPRRAPGRPSRGRQRPGRGAHRLGQDAGRVPLVARPAGHRAAPRTGTAPLPGPLRLPAQGARRRRRAQPPRAADRHPARRRRASACRSPTSPSAIRSGDTPADERRRFGRTPPDILITTPESLFLILTSQARESLRGVETVIVDEVHAVAGTKRGAHLALSLERLDALLDRPAQRIGLSATVRPVDEVARFLGGARAGRPSSQPAVDRRRSTSRSSCRSRT